ncbi:MAG: hypothetical protein DRJ38_01875 [Thermoprotei archaeon]|nr:MAG: hypothetical protein DRJ38_01875 [Thermoprotei archaeon]
MLKTFFAAINLLVGVLLVLLSIAWFRISPLVSVILLIASFDQFEDVYFLAKGRSLFPPILSGLDVGAELMQFVLGVAIMLFGASYMGKLEYQLLPELMIALGFMVSLSSAYDLALMPSRHRPVKKMEVLSIEEGLKRYRRILRRA